MREFLKWMQAGVAGLLVTIAAQLQAGGPINLAALGRLALATLAVRAAGYVVQKWGPQPPPPPPPATP